jgi:hypothetical protein
MTRPGILLILLACCVKRFQCPQQEPRGCKIQFKLYAKYMQQICSEYAIICKTYATKLNKYAKICSGYAEIYINMHKYKYA